MSQKRYVQSRCVIDKLSSIAEAVKVLIIVQNNIKIKTGMLDIRNNVETYLFIKSNNSFNYNIKTE